MPKPVRTSRKNDHADIHEGWTVKGVRRLRRLLPRSREVGHVVGDDIAIAALSLFNNLAEDHAELQSDFTAAFDEMEPMVEDKALTAALHAGHVDTLVEVSDRAFLAGFYAGARVAVKGGAR